jgi:DNA-binding response OmpR family regulator
MKTQSRAPKLPRQKKKILLLDDDPVSRKLRALVLVVNGFEVYGAASVDDARARLRPNGFDLVLVDCKNDAKAAQQFCQDLKKMDGKLRYARLSSNREQADHPHGEVVILKQEGPEYMVRQVRTMLEPAA